VTRHRAPRSWPSWSLPVALSAAGALAFAVPATAGVNADDPIVPVLGDKDCSDFATQLAAQAYVDGLTLDLRVLALADLDSDGDGVVCELLGNGDDPLPDNNADGDADDTAAESDDQAVPVVPRVPVTQAAPTKPADLVLDLPNYEVPVGAADTGDGSSLR
jgi:hypothetical protein